MSFFLSPIRRDSNNKVAKNFFEYEFFTGCSDFRQNSHYLDIRLVAAAQTVRNFIRQPVFITSSFRTKMCNQARQGASDSYHLKGMAVDLTCKDIALVNKEILSFSQLFKDLHKCGVKGFGIYDKHLHLDTRLSGSAKIENLGYTMWEISER